MPSDAARTDSNRVRGPKGFRTETILILAGCWILWGFGCQTVLNRLMPQVDGTVIVEQNVPSLGAPRYATHYTLRTPDGGLAAYVAGATDASLQRGLPVGTRIHKVRWQLGYDIDGRRTAFPWIFYTIMLCAGVGALGAGTVRLLKQRSGT